MIRSGLDRLVAEGFQRFDGQRLALLTHPASVDRGLQSTHACMNTAGMKVKLLLGPEHGLAGHAQDMESVEEGAANAGPRVVGLYGAGVESLRPDPKVFEDIDRLVVDLQDVGARYYTFAVSMRYCMEACALAGVPVTVLDRPNPIGGHLREGPGLDPAFFSFVGGFAMPVRHGLTLGELARLATAEGVEVELEVVAMEGWDRRMWFDDTGLPWVLPSPNMPSLDTAVVYPGGCLLEATNLSEGRGTTRPFELVGAPWIDGKALAARMKGVGLPGVAFRSCHFTPTFQKHAGELCGGVQLHVTDRESFQAFATGAVLIQEMRRQNPQRFAWRSATYEFVSHIPAMDMLSGSSALRECIDSDGDVRDLKAGWERDCAEFSSRLDGIQLY